jgi:hypothetical protein
MCAKVRLRVRVRVCETRVMTGLRRDWGDLGQLEAGAAHVAARLRREIMGQLRKGADCCCSK